MADENVSPTLSAIQNDRFLIWTLCYACYLGIIVRISILFVRNLVYDTLKV
jgi:hypothetical protein